jgi:hypothetical protein
MAFAPMCLTLDSNLDRIRDVRNSGNLGPHVRRTRGDARACTIGRPWPRHHSPWQNELTMTSRFLWALGVYAVLALMAAFTLDGNLRVAVWILLAGLTVKTCIAYKAGW